MKHSLFFWSRTIHCWVGLYLGAVTALWLGELTILPVIFAPELPVHTPEVSGSVSALEPNMPSKKLSAQAVLVRFLEERVDGEELQPESVTYLPGENLWVIRDRRHYVSVTYDAETGSVRRRDFDEARLIEEKHGLSWLNPRLGAMVKSTFHPLFILLCATGLHLWGSRKKRHAKTRGDKPGLSAV